MVKSIYLIMEGSANPKNLVSTKKPIKEGKTSISVGNHTINFIVTSVNKPNPSIQFMAASSKDLDILKTATSKFIGYLQNYCNQKTGLKWNHNSDSPAAGYVFTLDMDSVVAKL